MINFKMFFLFLLLLNSLVTNAEISDFRLCGNEDCTEVISHAVTKLLYNSPQEGVLSFRPNVAVKIYSKSAGSNTNLWGVEINGRRGYAPQSLLREIKIIKGLSDLKHLVPTGFQVDSKPPSKIISNEIVKENPAGNPPPINPDAVAPPYEVFKGTTIFNPDYSADSYQATPNSNVVTEPIQQSEGTIEGTTVAPTVAITPDTKAVNQNLNDVDNVPKESPETKSVDLEVSNKLNDKLENGIVNKNEESKSQEINPSDKATLRKENDDDEDGEEEDAENEEEGNVEEEDDEDVPDLSQAKEESKPEPEKQDINVQESPKTIEVKENLDNLNVQNSQENQKEDVKIEQNIHTSQDKDEGKPEPEKQDINVQEPLKTVQNIEVKQEGNEKNDVNIEGNMQTKETVVKTNNDVEKTNEKMENNVDLQNMQQNATEPRMEKSEPEQILTEIKDNIVASQNVPSLSSGQATNSVEQKVEEVPKNIEPPIPEKLPLVSDPVQLTTEPSMPHVPLPPFFHSVEAITTENPIQNEPTVPPSEPVFVENPSPNQSEIPPNQNAQQINAFKEAMFKQNKVPQTNQNADLAKETVSMQLEHQPDGSNLNAYDANNAAKEAFLVPNSLHNQLVSEVSLSNQNIDVVNETNPISNLLENPPENSQSIVEDAKQEMPVTQPLTGAVENVEMTSDVPESYQPIENPYVKLNDEASVEVMEEKVPETTEEPGLITKLYSFFGSSDEAAPNEMKNDEETTKEAAFEETKPLDDIKPSETPTPEDNAIENKIQEDAKLTEEIIQEINQVQEAVPTITEFEPKINAELNTPLENSKPGELNSESFEKHTHEKPFDKYLPKTDTLENVPNEIQSCDPSENPSDCLAKIEAKMSDPFITKEEDSWISFELSENGLSILLYLSLTAITVLIFSLGHYYIEKRRIDGSLISNINNLEKKLLVTSKESLLLQDELKLTKEKLLSVEDSSTGSVEEVTTLKEELEEAKNIRFELEEQISNLERELENSTEAGLELNRMLTEFLSSQNGNDNIMENVERLQKQLFEQQSTINNMNATLSTKNTENELLQTELTVSNGKIEQLQSELDNMVVNLLSVQEEKSKTEFELEEKTKMLQEEYENKIKLISNELHTIKEENNKLKDRSVELQRALELKNNEFAVLKESMSEVQAINTSKESLAALLDVSKVKAEVQQLREEKHVLTEKLQSEKKTKLVAEKEIQVVLQEMQILKDKFDEAERDKVEAQTRLDVLSTYFKDKEAQLQKKINEHESMWEQKQGEATSTVERIKWIQEELQNYKSQNELLKKEILDQEVSLKSQISMLEKKAHDNWVLARQSERKLEDSKQEASQLRNRLTIVEKNLNNSTQLDDSKLQNRVLQPIESNGDIAVSPLHMGAVEATGSPPLLYPHRDHMTTSPPLPGMPFMPPPPPPGVPFMPPPPGVPPFMPPPMYPGDHRPPPLGRMSSPPGRYSPDSRYSPYERDDSPPMSPAYENDYRRGRSPPPHASRAYSPYGKRGQWDDMRDYRQQPRMKPRSHKGTGLSSASGNSNESLDNSGRHSGRV